MPKKARNKSSLPIFLPLVSRSHALAEECCHECSDEELLAHSVDHECSIELLAWAIQQPSHSVSSIETYLRRYSSFRLRSALTTSVESDSAGEIYPILFFAVERNSPPLVSLLCRAGASPHMPARPSLLPLLAYCVISAEYKITDTTETLVALLSAGANADDIPRDMWENYVEAPKMIDPDQDEPLASKRYKWRTAEIRKALCRNLTLLQRYYLRKADLLPKETEVTKQVAEALRIENVFQVPYHIVGQLPAVRKLIDQLTSYLMMSSHGPLVLLFAGPSGHGKTEVACQVGDLLSLDRLHIDCTEMEHESDLFGPKAPYRGYEQGSPLNNFLAEHTGCRSVVFLDEFDKTTDDVRKAMLLVLDTGHYRNRIDSKQLDCSKAIWIMATNHGEEDIKRFWDEYLVDQPEERQLSAPVRILEAQLKRRFIDAFGAPLTGRVSSIIPFLPFTKNEQAVIAYTFMRKLKEEIRKPIDVDANRFVGDSHLNFLDDGQIARNIASLGFIPEIGARSLHNEVNAQVEQRLAGVVLQGHERIEDTVDETKLSRYDVRLVDGLEGEKELEVKKAGTTRLQLRETDCYPL